MRRHHRMFPTTEYPALSDLIVYYVTRVVGVPIFVDTDLQWFHTPRFFEWVKENNLPGNYLDVMRGSLVSDFNCRIPRGVSIELPRPEIEKIERWLTSWKQDTFERRYTMALRNFPEYLPN